MVLIICPFIPRIAPHLSSIEALEKYDSDRPDVHLIGDLWRLFTHHKTLRGEVPYSHNKTQLSYIL